MHARAELGHDRAVEAVLGDGGKEQIRVGPTGSSRDGDSAVRLRVDDAGIVAYQTAPGFARCDGDDLLFPERWDFAGKRFRPVTNEAPAGARLRATPNAPSGIGGPPLGLFRFTAESTDASGESRADRLGAPRELEDGSPTTVWHAGFGPAARGAWVTARTAAGARELKAIEIVPGKEAPKTIAVILGPSADAQFTVELGNGVGWVTLPARPATSCVSVAVLEPGARQNALAEVRFYTDMDGPAGLERLAGDVAEMKPNADGAAHLLTERGLPAARVVAEMLPTTSGLGRRRLLQVLATIGAEESAPALGKALETAEAADRALLVGALGKMGAAGAKEAIRVYGDESQTAEARADAALVLGELGGQRAAIDALVAGAGKGPPAVREATMVSLVRVYDAAGGAVERALAEAPAGDEARVGDLARALGRAAARGGARPATTATAALAAAWTRTKPTEFALRLRLVRAMGDVADGALAATLADAAHDSAPEVRAAAVTAAARVPAGAATVRAGASDDDAGVRRAGARRRWRATRRRRARYAGARQRRLADGAAHGGRGARRCLPRAWRSARAAVARGHRRRQDDGRRRRRRGGAARGAGRRRSLQRRAAVGLTGVLAEKRQPIAVRELAAALVAKHGGAEAAHALAATHRRHARRSRRRRALRRARGRLHARPRAHGRYLAAGARGARRGRERAALAGGARGRDGDHRQALSRGARPGAGQRCQGSGGQRTARGARGAGALPPLARGRACRYAARMDFAPSPTLQPILDKVERFIRDEAIPLEPRFSRQLSRACCPSSPSCARGSRRSGCGRRSCRASSAAWG